MDRPREQVIDRVGRRLGRFRWTGAIRARRSAALPDRWWMLTGRVMGASFAICMVTGVIVLFVYDPSTATVTYDGAYAPLRGVEMSRALESTLRLSFEVGGGMFVRQLHHWSASLMIAALLVHILRIFLTGAFRRPRRLRWFGLIALLAASMAAGLTGSVLPDDVVSGSSLAVFDGLMKSVPVFGSELSYLVFQGAYPVGAIATFYPLHVLIVPIVLIALAALTARRAGARELPPASIGTSVGVFCLVGAVLAGAAATVTVNPVWLYGPADPGTATAGAGAVWYLAFLDGAQRLVPPGWELRIGDTTLVLALLVPLGVCGLFFVVAAASPIIERRVTGDHGCHNRLDRPRDRPVRTGIGASAVTFYAVLWSAAGSDSIAASFSLGIEGVVRTLQVVILIGPVIAYALADRTCRALQRRDREEAAHGYETGRIIRAPGGGYSMVMSRQPVEAVAQIMRSGSG